MKGHFNSEKIRIGDQIFEKYLNRDAIRARIQELGKEISLDYRDKNPLFVIVLNGAFMFAADLLRATTVECELQFVKLSSYDGTTSSGQVKKIIGLQETLNERHVIILEDIIDTGRTIMSMFTDLETHKPASVSVATLLLKSDSLQFELESTYVGFEIPDAFVVGYGLDLDGKARNLCDIYQLCS